MSINAKCIPKRLAYAWLIAAEPTSGDKTTELAGSKSKFEIESRESVGKKSTKAIRREGKIPSTLYYKGEEPESIAIDKIKLYQALKSDQRVYEVELSGESQYVMVKAVQYHPVTDEIVHLDFMRVRRSEKMTISVPLVPVSYTHLTLPTILLV